MKPIVPKPQRCAIYTRKSTEHNLDLEFNSLDAQREACEAYIKSQAHEGWRLVPDRYDDGGLSGTSLDRPALQNLLADVGAGKINTVVVYKVDRLTRSLADFAKLVELFDQHGVSFVSITQSFNTTSSMGRLTLNVLLSFAQFEREVIGERVRDKIAASKRKGLWVGGPVPLGYRCIDKKLVVVPEEAEVVRTIFTRYLELGSMGALLTELDRQGMRTKVNGRRDGGRSGGICFGGPICSRTGSTSARSPIGESARVTRGNVGDSPQRGNKIPETGLPGCRHIGDMSFGKAYRPPRRPEVSREGFVTLPNRTRSNSAVCIAEARKLGAFLPMQDDVGR
jgi:DNA invertase Pin-like site-specific DNA recombinase